jgi:hypothetical protein
MTPPKLVIAALVADTKSYVLAYWLQALQALRWPGEKHLFIVYDGQHPGDFALYSGDQVTVASGAEVDVGMDTPGRIVRIGMLHEVARQGILRDHPDADWVFWVDSDVLVPADAAERLTAHGAPLASGVVVTRTGSALLARKTKGHAAMLPGKLGTLPQDVAITGFGCLMMQARMLNKFHWCATEQERIINEGMGEDGHAILETGETVVLDPNVICVHYAENLVGYTLEDNGDGWRITALEPQMRQIKTQIATVTYRGPHGRVGVDGIGFFDRDVPLARGHDLATISFDNLVAAIADAQEKHAKRVRALKGGAAAERTPVDYDEGLLKFATNVGEDLLETPVTATPPVWLKQGEPKALPLGCDDLVTGAVTVQPVENKPAKKTKKAAPLAR